MILLLLGYQLTRDGNTYRGILAVIVISTCPTSSTTTSVARAVLLLVASAMFTLQVASASYKSFLASLEKQWIAYISVTHTCT